MSFVKWFENLDKNDAGIAGGKGASLGEMTQAGIPVPPGFVILAGAFEQFLADTDLNVEIEAILRTVKQNEVHTVENASEKIRALIMAENISVAIAQEIQKNFKQLGAKYVAVRSSATAEDSAQAAWAGQLNSYLNTTSQDLLENIKKCWASLFTARAIFYRFEKKLNNKNISVAVVVQTMVDCQKSGVSFSVHPITEDANQLIIEAGWGLGEAIVSGKITPDSYVVNKKFKKIIDINVNVQASGLYRGKNGGTIWRKILAKQGAAQVLTNKEILELAEMIVRVETHYGFPCDIEWGRDKRFYILQSRPITTLLGANQVCKKTQVIDYVKTQSWFMGQRADESLLFYSIKQDKKCLEYIAKRWGIPFAETLLIPKNKDYPVRVFNLAQAKAFHAVSKKKILKNPRVLVEYVEKNNRVWSKILSASIKLIQTVERGQYFASEKLVRKIIEDYKIASAQFLLIFSLGMKLTENVEQLKNVKAILRAHDVWRNSIALKEEEMGEAIFYFLELLIKQKKLAETPNLIMKYLTLAELNDWMDDKLANKEVRNIIQSRWKRGFAYGNLRNFGEFVLDDTRQIKQLQKYFLQLQAGESKTTNGALLTGQVAYAGTKRVRGRVVIVLDKYALRDKVDLLKKDTILVAIQTTPHFIPYLSRVKAIITDEGGITCHAAIVAREMKKPCLIGTKTATDVLQDGDVVELNLESGTVNRFRE